MTVRSRRLRVHVVPVCGDSQISSQRRRLAEDERGVACRRRLCQVNPLGGDSRDERKYTWLTFVIRSKVKPDRLGRARDSAVIPSENSRNKCRVRQRTLLLRDQRQKCRRNSDDGMVLLQRSETEH